MNDVANLQSQLTQLLQQRSPAWELSCETSESGAYTISLSHPASHGLIYIVEEHDSDAVVRVASAWLADNEELSIADAAPTLAHPELVLGLRTLTAAFDWPNEQVRSVAFLLAETEALNREEAAWLAGFVGSNAPGQVVDREAG